MNDENKNNIIVDDENKVIKIKHDKLKTFVSKAIGGITAVTIIGFTYIGTIKLAKEAGALPELTTYIENDLKESDIREYFSQMELAKKLDYYETAKSTYTKLTSSGSNIRVQQSQLDREAYFKENKLNLDISNDEFEDLVRKSFENVYYSNKIGVYEKLSDEQLKSMKEEVINNYVTIKNYIDENYDNDYNIIFNEILEEKLKNSLRNNNVESLYVNNISFVKLDDKRYAQFDLTINGENKSIMANGVVSNILYKVKNNNEKSIINLSKLINTTINYDNSTNSINGKFNDILLYHPGLLNALDVLFYCSLYFIGFFGGLYIGKETNNKIKSKLLAPDTKK